MKAYENNIKDIITRYNKVNEERSTLNKAIRDWYEPQLLRLAEADDKVGFDALLDEVPDCPCLLSFYRMREVFKF